MTVSTCPRRQQKNWAPNLRLCAGQSRGSSLICPACGVPRAEYLHYSARTPEEEDRLPQRSAASEALGIAWTAALENAEARCEAEMPVLATDGNTLEEDADEHSLAGPKPSKEQAAAAKKLKEDKAAAAKQEKQEHEAARAALLHTMTLEELGRIQTIHDHLTNVDTLCSLVDNGTLPASKVVEAVKPKDSPPEQEYWSGLVGERRPIGGHRAPVTDFRARASDY